MIMIFTSCDDQSIEGPKSYSKQDHGESVFVSSSSALGQVFFSDPRFSSDGRVACSSCHRAEFAFADTTAISRGVWGRQGIRNTPTLVGLHDDILLMWDGGVTPLRHGSQGILAALTAHRDQDMNPIDLEKKLRHFINYKLILNRLYPRHSLAAGYLLSIREYVREVATISKTRDRSAKNSNGIKNNFQKNIINQGLVLFQGKAGCISCHHGPSLTDGRFYNLGLDSVDPGRAAITLLEEDRGRFRTPPLVFLKKTAPYFHNGSAQTLNNVLQHYINGAGEAGQISLNSTEQNALLAYLNSL